MAHFSPAFFFVFVCVSVSWLNHLHLMACIHLHSRVQCQRAGLARSKKLRIIAQ